MLYGLADTCPDLFALTFRTREAIRDWNPSALDTDKWVEAAVSFGAKYIVLVVRPTGLRFVQN